MELDYQSILLQGYLDPKKRPHFADYLYRQYQEARKENYSANEFFGGCSHEIQRMKGMVEAQCLARKVEIDKMLVGIRSGKIKDDSGLEKELLNDLSLLKVEDFTLNLLNATNHKFKGQLEYGHLYAIELLIGEAIQKIDHSMPLEEKKKTKKHELTLKEIALLLFYSNRPVPRLRSESDLIAKEYYQNSGEKLYQHYTDFSKRTMRIGNPGTKKKLENRIRSMEKVESLLNEEEREQCSNELAILRTHLKGYQ